MYNKQQLEAINSLDGRIRVIAGAGTGKTATNECNNRKIY